MQRVALIGMMLVLTCMTAQAVANDLISIDVKDALLSDVLSSIAKFSGKDMIQKGNLSERINLSIKDNDYRYVLRMLAFSYGLEIRETQGILIVRGKSENTAPSGMVTRIFRLQFADADEVSGILKSTFKGLKDFNVAVDKRNNAVIVTCMESDIGLVQAVMP